MRYRSVFPVLILAASLACADDFGPSDFDGTWGVEGARLTLTLTQALFESPCWSGPLTLPLLVDGPEFEALGTMNSQGGAGQSEVRIATFTGRLSGDQIHLTVEPASMGLGPYTLQKDAQVTIPGCP